MTKNCLISCVNHVLGNGTFQTLVMGLFGPKTIFLSDVKKIVRVGPFSTGKVRLPKTHKFLFGLVTLYVCQKIFFQHLIYI